MSRKIDFPASQIVAGDISAQFQQAFQYHQQGDFARAADGYRAILSQAPQHVEAAFNLGVACFEMRQYSEAAAGYAQAASLAPDDSDVWFNLGLALKAQGSLEEAVTCYETAIELAPDQVDSHYNLGIVLHELHRHEEAAARFRVVLEKEPEHVSALNNLGVVCHSLNRREEAIDCFQRAAALGHKPESATHILAALTGDTPEAPPTEYVRTLFDDFSERFDQCLTEALEYRTPEVLRAQLHKLTGAPERFAEVVDLGCGTGLSGEAFREMADRLTGVDLSEGMVAVAGEKNIYDRLEVGEVAQFLEENDDRYDLFVATDVFVYLGDLSGVFEAVRAKAKAGSFFLFSTESHDGEGFVLRSSGRYAHAADYLENLAEANGFEVVTRSHEKIRKERGEWILGDLFVMRLA